MPASEDDQRIEDPPAEERRKRARAPARPGDWESLALSRVADRVEAITGTPDEADPGLDATIEYGWEQRLLANLRAPEAARQRLTGTYAGVRPPCMLRRGGVTGREPSA